jgi:hypothetical protein
MSNYGLIKIFVLWLIKAYGVSLLIILLGFMSKVHGVNGRERCPLLTMTDITLSSNAALFIYLFTEKPIL